MAFWKIMGLGFFIVGLSGDLVMCLSSTCDFPAIYNFGDSNSDTGGISAAFYAVPPPNGEVFFGKPFGRACDGRLLIDFVAGYLGLPYLSAYLDSIGSNFRCEFCDGWLNNSATKYHLKQLYQQGARAFWIHNTGPIGCLPFSLIYYGPKPPSLDANGCVKPKSEVAQEFNRQLKEKVTRFRSSIDLSDAALTYVDVYSAKYTLITDAKKQGFVDPLKFCCGHHNGYDQVFCGAQIWVNGTEIYGTSCGTSSMYISWDGVHYSQAANKWVASNIFNGQLSNPPIPITQACHKLMHL